MARELFRKFFTEIRARSRAGDDNTGCGRDDECRNLSDQAVTDREQRENLGGLADVHAFLERADDDSADDVDEHD
jgi:hypothetical protein